MISIFKKQVVTFQSIVAICLLTFTWTFLLAPGALAVSMDVPAGTVVLLSTNETLVPEQLNIGDNVNLMVVSDVSIDGTVVIKAGANAKAEVTMVKKQGYIGIPAKLGIAVRSVQAVDGTTIMLSGNKVSEGKDNMVASIGLSLVCCILFALMKGGEAVIPSGTQVQSTVSATTKINL